MLLNATSMQRQNVARPAVTFPECNSNEMHPARIMVVHDFRSKLPRQSIVIDWISAKGPYDVRHGRRSEVIQNSDLETGTLQPRDKTAEMYCDATEGRRYRTKDQDVENILDLLVKSFLKCLATRKQHGSPVLDRLVRAAVSGGLSHAHILPAAARLRQEQRRRPLTTPV